MMKRISARTLVVFTLLATTAFGCGLFGSPPEPADALRDFIEDEVDDPDRASRMLSSVERIDGTLKRFRKDARQRARTLRKAHADFDTTRDELQQLFDKSNSERDQARRALLNALIELRDLATNEEWEEIADLQERLFRENYSPTLPIEGSDA